MMQNDKNGEWEEKIEIPKNLQSNFVSELLFDRKSFAFIVCAKLFTRCFSYNYRQFLFTCLHMIDIHNIQQVSD